MEFNKRKLEKIGGWKLCVIGLEVYKKSWKNIYPCLLLVSDSWHSSCKMYTVFEGGGVNSGLNQTEIFVSISDYYIIHLQHHDYQHGSSGGVQGERVGCQAVCYELV